jgi:hypothetical protein
VDRKHGPSRAPRLPGLCGRTLRLVDIENMVGSCQLSLGDVARARVRINAAIAPRAQDHTVIAASHYNAPAAYFGWTDPVRRLARSGKDGADLALLEVIADVSWVAARYDRVVVASGDHAFAPAVAELKGAGVEVIVIRPDTGFSARMRLAAGPDVVALGSSLPAKVINLFPSSKDAA